MLDKLIRWSTRYMAVGVMIAGFLGILFPAAMKPYARFIPFGNHHVWHGHEP